MCKVFLGKLSTAKVTQSRDVVVYGCCYRSWIDFCITVDNHVSQACHLVPRNARIELLEFVSQGLNGLAYLAQRHQNQISMVAICFYGVQGNVVIPFAALNSLTKRKDPAQGV